MNVTAYRKAPEKYGIYVGKNKDVFRAFAQVKIEIDGHFYEFDIRESFFDDCTHIDDSDCVTIGITPIKNWLVCHHNIDWKKPNRPPRFQLSHLDGACFRLDP